MPRTEPFTKPFLFAVFEGVVSMTVQSDQLYKWNAGVIKANKDIFAKFTGFPKTQSRVISKSKEKIVICIVNALVYNIMVLMLKLFIIRIKTKTQPWINLELSTVQYLEKKYFSSNVQLMLWNVFKA